MLIRLIKDFFIGIRAYFKAFVFIYEHNLWFYFIVPALVSVILFFSGNLLLDELRVHDFNTGLQGLDFDAKLKTFKFGEIIPTDTEVDLMVGALKLVFVISAFAFNKYLVLILLAPLNTWISAKTERILTGNSYPFDYKQLVSDIYRTINFSIRNVFRQGFLIGLWLLIAYFVPYVDKASPYIIFWIAAYYYGATLIDYNSERRKLSWEESIQFIKRYSGMALSLGGVFSLMYFNSYVGIIVAPIMGVVAATIAVHDRIGLKRKGSLNNAIKTIEKEKKQRALDREEKTEPSGGENVLIRKEENQEDWEY